MISRQIKNHIGPLLGDKTNAYRLLSLLPKEKFVSVFHPSIDWKFAGKVASLLTRSMRPRPAIKKTAHFTDGQRRLATMELNVAEYTQCRYYFGLLDHPLLDQIKKGGSCFLDIGSNVGLYSLLAANYFETVHSFECQTESLELFSKNIQLSGKTNITLHPIGLSNQNTDSTLFQNPLNHGGSSLDEPPKAARARTKIFSVRLEKLDDQEDIQNLRAIDFIKIDVEGHEPKVLQGAEQTIRKFRPTVFIEVSQIYDRFVAVRNSFPSNYGFRNLDGSDVTPANVGTDVIGTPT